MAEPELQRMSEQAFFSWQEKQERLYELVDGLPVLPLKMMTGASRAHDRAVVNIVATLHGRLRGGPCSPTTADLAVRIPAGNIRRPDVTIECGQGGRRDMAVKEPRVIVEVLSPSTMSFDRFKKVVEYQTIATVTHILLVDTEVPRVDVLSRAGGGTWTSTRHEGLDAKIELPTINASLGLDEVFEGMEFGEQ
jgi:Uma2 family endonuclease